VANTLVNERIRHFPQNGETPGVPVVPGADRIARSTISNNRENATINGE